ncbi:MAG TPA: lactonase family protein [Pseudolysinimonas sp.]|nr:lactonase family protein [Pseudolysinimonas sp.]
MSTSRLLIGTYTEKLPHVDGKADGILGSEYDASGALSPTTVLAEVRNPSWLVASAEGTRVYTVVETVDFEGQPGGGAAAYARDPQTGELTLINAVPSGGTEPAHIEIDPSGRYVLEANYRTGSVAVFAIRDDGGLGETVEHVQFEGSGPHPIRQTNPHAHQIVFDPTIPGRVLIPDLGTDSLRSFDFGADGSLTEHPERVFRTAPGAGPRHIAFHPGGEHLFLLNELDNTLLVLRRDGDGFVQTNVASTLPDGHTGHSQGAAIRVSPSGRHVLTSNRGFDSIAIFAFDETAQTVTLKHLEPTQGLEPRDFVFTPDGSQVLVANQDSDSVLAFDYDDSAPALRHRATSAALTPTCLVFV